jgi:hypothetical protein
VAGPEQFDAKADGITGACFAWYFAHRIRCPAAIRFLAPADIDRRLDAAPDSEVGAPDDAVALPPSSRRISAMASSSFFFWPPYPASTASSSSRSTGKCPYYSNGKLGKCS